MGVKYVNPTHIELTHPKKKLVAAICEHKLLEDRWDKLMRQFLDLMHGNKALREKVEAGVAVANQNFVLARPGITDEALNVALTAPKQGIYLETKTRNVMSMEIPVFRYKTGISGLSDIYSYGSAFTFGDLNDAVKSLVGSLSDVLRLARCEKSCQLMAAEIEKTHRRVNALEHVVIPDTQSNIHYIAIKLGENERSFQTRFMKVKDMMLKEVRHYSERKVVPVAGEIWQTSS